MDNDSSLTSSGEDPDLAILNQFLAELCAAERQDRSEVISRYCLLHPELEDRIRKIGSGTSRVEALFEEGGPSVTGPATGPDFVASAFPPRFGPYRVIRPIGRGGMGEVYEAEEDDLPRRVAVKTIRRAKAANPGQFERFDRERRVLARLHHTHIVPIFATGRQDDLLYFAMPYIRGVALNELINAASRHSHENGNSPLTNLESLVEVARSEAAETARRKQEGPSIEADKTDPGPSSRNRTNGDARTTLPLRYFRAIAAMIADAAEALHHAHEAGVIHRDLKPSNIMIEPSGYPWVLDFGLARLRAELDPTRSTNSGARTDTQNPGGDPQADGTIDHQVDHFLTLGPVGTPAYMAPEQHLNGNGSATQEADGLEHGAGIDARTDVWGLGATLYELLTLQRAFRNRDQILRGSPDRPRRHVAYLPRDLEAVCLKTLQKDPSHRYQTAQALADDLRRWLASEPVISRKAHTLRRFALWAKRNKGWAAAILISFLAIIGGGLGTADYFRIKANAALADAKAAQTESAKKDADLRAVSQLERQHQHELLLQSIQHRRTTPHMEGWSDDVWKNIREAGSAGPGGDAIDRALQSQAVADLFGLDIRRIRQIKEFGADSLAFDRHGGLLIGSVVGANDRRRTPISSKLLSSAFQPPRDLATAAHGPVSFRPDDTPVQFVSTDREGKNLDEPYLVDMSTGKTLTRFTLPGPLEIESPMQIGLAADGSLAAAPVREKAGTTIVVVWDCATGRERRRFTWPSTSIAFSPDGSLLASGSADGRIAVWSLASGDRIADLGAGRTEINCLSFGLDPVLRTSRDPNPKAPAHGWLLAAGDQSAVVTVYDLERKQARSICRGSGNEIFAVAFAPDRATLASSGRHQARLWDVATGRMLLSFWGGSYSHGLAFSRDGRRLAIGTMPVWAPEPVSILELDSGRGIQTYRGLAGQVGEVCFSPDGRRLAVLSHDWQAAVWDRDSGRLVAVIGVPPAHFVDNAALALSPDGRLLAYAGGHEARLWDLETGAERAWSFRQGEADHEGLQDQLAFTSPDRLLSARVENRDGRGRPAGVMSPNNPRVVRVRNLLGPEPLKPVTEVTDLELAVDGTHMTRDAKYLVCSGFTGPRGQTKHLLNGYEAATGKRLWSVPVTAPPNSVYVGLDPTSSTLCFSLSGERQGTLLEIAGGKYLGTTEICWFSLGPLANLGMNEYRLSPQDPPGLALLQRDNGRERILFRPLHDSSFQPNTFKDFTRDGRFAAVGNADGSIIVFDFEAINRRLSEIGMGW
jgi:serine/threonine protein kinase/WD40 repeat protein